ncbi:MAG: quinolinate synthase NadA [Candidatus Methanomethylophilaceae archaeon]|jgi:quinolinate synthase|nr:quinolinate synthase NadA [Candidatus Methanomethylophilaceae archaeon]
MASLADRISELKREKDAVILAHNYTSDEVQDLADYVGDSLGLSVKAASTEASVIVFCGVSFMGETAKILSPGKTVLLPEPEAHCAMASMCTAQQIRDMRKRHPGAAVVGYVNTSAESKAEMDVCCTSSNAVAVVRSLEEKDVIFVPDKNLGAYVASKVPEKNIILWDGFCPVHQSITVKNIADLKEKHPNARVLAHPECRPEVLSMSDSVGSTEGMVVAAESGEEFIVATEKGMEHRFRGRYPEKSFHFPVNAVCLTMKMVEPESVLRCLETFEGRVELDEKVLRSAYLPVKRMTDIK